MNQGGDVLARGAKSAQFAAGGSDLTDFEYDLRTREEIVAEKYGLSEHDIVEYKQQMNEGLHPDVKPIAAVEELGAGITVIDKRSFLGAAVGEVPEVKKPEPKYPEKSYGLGSPILDRVLIKRCAEHKDLKLLEDGSVLNTKTGLIIAGKYRQHSNVGVVLATGQFVILGGQRIAMSEVVRVGDRVTYGDYNSEVFVMDESKVQEMCDAVQMNYEPDPEGLRVVRVQDIRIVEREVPNTETLYEGNSQQVVTNV